jgi:hypothetical protein
VTAAEAVAVTTKPRSLGNLSRVNAFKRGLRVMKFSVFPMLALVALMAQRADAQALSTAGDVQSQCAKPGQEQACSAFALGFAQGVAAANNDGVKVCIPKGVGGRELRLVMDKYFKDHPERLHEKVSAVLGAAFAAAYPCQK